MGYIRVPLDTNPSDLAQDVFDYINGQAPQWIPSEGNLDVWIIRAVAQMASELRDLATDVQDDIFRYFGATLVGLQPIDATAAQGNTTWYLNDSLGHTISAGTTVGIIDANNNVIPFQVANDVTVPNGSNQTQAGEVIIRAILPGAQGNALGGAGAAIQLIDVIDWVQRVELTGPTAGGADAEDDITYLNRLARYMQRLSLRPILPADFAAMTLDVDPVIQRAVCIDLYNPADHTTNNQRMVTIVAIDSAGNDVPQVVKNEIISYLQANREVNFIVNTMAPNYTTVSVTTTIHVATGYDTTSVNNAVIGAINNYLSPATWGQDPSILEASIVESWIDIPKVYFNEVITLISNVAGVDRVISLTLNGGTVDISLTTPASLTKPGTVTVTDA